MKVKLEWLNELVDISDLCEEEIIKVLSLYSIEVESSFKVLNGTNLVIGYVLSAERMKDSNHLSICQVDIGCETLPIVCGAPNVKSGQYVIVAKVGAELPGGFKIKRTKIRGMESKGMICSLEELGLEKKYIPEEYQNGIYYFKEEVKIGSDPLKALNFADTIIELGVTPNRGDLLSMLGVAIEISAVYNRPLKMPRYNLTYSPEECRNYVTVTNESADCIGYYAQIFKNIEIKPSPWWLVSRLIAFGVRPINNVVDITNYILALFGQPLHAFDYCKLGKQITIRKAKAKELFVTLDGVQRELVAADLLITDGNKAVALAGVMGGLNTEIDNTTNTIVLEAAVFKPETVSKTSRRLDLISDSSIRFEKGVDINRTKIALDYAAYLLQTLAGAEVLNNPVFVGVDKISPVKIPINAADVNNLLGSTITENEIKEICHRLKFTIDENNIVSVPNRRPDVKIKEDLIEEIGRLSGYDKLPSTLPITPSIGYLNDKQIIRRKIKDILVGLGLNQLITYSLTSEDNNNLFSLLVPEKSKAIELLNPTSSARNYLRTSLLPGLVENAKYCYSHKIKDLAVFELGKIYYQSNKYCEYEHLALLMTKQYSEILWQGKEETVDFYLIKGICDSLFYQLRLNIDYLPLDIANKELHPKRSAVLYSDGKMIGFIGALHPQFASAYNLDEVYVAEINLTAILERKIEPIKYQSFSKFPFVERDIAVIVNRNVSAGALVDTIKQTGNKNLSKIKIFDVYTGDQISAAEKSIAIKLFFSANHVLTDEDINQMVGKIVKKLADNHQAKLREE
ncbi:MAG: phenylalanine--tRNA ligase subunit beta [Bacilli bacterium]|nr:phenylalanine--tRNA ligase subunit beta [Bacilli bacterium]MDD4388120.1 phenylalanine--tRNA ligase subunit beta [Bacilli bacterium]